MSVAFFNVFVNRSAANFFDRACKTFNTRLEYERPQTTNHMTHLLDRASAYTSTSRRLVIESLRQLPEQMRLGWRDARAVVFPRTYQNVRQVVIAGMGGSTLGSDVIRSVYSPSLRVPMTIVNGYRLPGSVNAQTLVLLSSYSGDTEEVLAAAKEATRRGAKVTGLTKGGQLAGFFERRRVPWYMIDGSANPAGQPRMGLGYSVMGQLGLLTSAGILRVTSAEASEAITTVKQRLKNSDPSVPTERNKAKRLAWTLLGRTPILIGAGPLVGSLHAFANQLNETAKVFATSFPLPELNHHLLEGLRFPRLIRQGTVVAFHSDLYWPRIVERERITLEIVRKMKLGAERVVVNGPSRLAQAVDVLGLAGATSFFLSVLYRVDPLAIPTVVELKKRLAS